MELQQFTLDDHAMDDQELHFVMFATDPNRSFADHDVERIVYSGAHVAVWFVRITDHSDHGQLAQCSINIVSLRPDHFQRASRPISFGTAHR